MTSLTLILVMTLLGQSPAPAPAPPAPDIEVTVIGKGKVGRYLPVVAKTKGEEVLWLARDAGIEFLSGDLSPKDTHVAGVIADAPGIYRLMAITAVNNKPKAAEFVVVFEGKAPSPPGPGPAPPTPVPPGPVDFASKIQAAYTADGAEATVKDAQRKVMIGLYQAMAEHAKNAGILTTTDLLKDLRDIAGQMLAPAAIKGCRAVIAAEVAAALGTDLGARLDPDLRPKAVEVFARIASTLERVK